MNAILPFIIEHWAAISAIIAAIGLRLFPTEKNYDVFQKILKLLDLIVPNMKKGGGRHAAKLILFFALAFVSVESSAQLNTRTRQIRFAIGVQKAADTAATVDNAGRIWYDFVTGRYRANFDGTNDFFGEGGGIVTASEGLNTVGNDVRLGGTLTGGTLTTINSTDGNGIAMSMGGGSGTNTGAIQISPSFSDIRHTTAGGNIAKLLLENGQFKINGDVTITSTTTASELYSGTYTPTLTNVSNAQDLSANQHNYLRVGNVVSISGAIETTPTAVATVIVGISLPIASNFTTGYDASGPAICWTVAGAPVGSITASVTSDILELQYLPTSSGANHRYFYTLNYVVK